MDADRGRRTYFASRPAPGGQSISSASRFCIKAFKTSSLFLDNISAECDASVKRDSLSGGQTCDFTFYELIQLGIFRLCFGRHLWSARENDQNDAHIVLTPLQMRGQLSADRATD